MGCAVDVPTDKRAISSAVQPGGSIVCLPRGAGVGFGVFVSLTEVTFAIPAYPGMPSSTRLISCNSAARIEDVRASRVTLKDVIENTETRTDRDSRPNSTPDLFTESAVRIIDLDDDVGVPPVVERHDVADAANWALVIVRELEWRLPVVRARSPGSGYERFVGRSAVVDHSGCVADRQLLRRCTGRECQGDVQLHGRSSNNAAAPTARGAALSAATSRAGVVARWLSRSGVRRFTLRGLLSKPAGGAELAPGIRAFAYPRQRSPDRTSENECRPPLLPRRGAQFVWDPAPHDRFPS
jgi:hypothetical protein